MSHKGIHLLNRKVSGNHSEKPDRDKFQIWALESHEIQGNDTQQEKYGDDIKRVLVELTRCQENCRQDKQVANREQDEEGDRLRLTATNSATQDVNIQQSADRRMNRRNLRFEVLSNQKNPRYVQEDKYSKYFQASLN